MNAHGIDLVISVAVKVSLSFFIEQLFRLLRSCCGSFHWRESFAHLQRVTGKRRRLATEFHEN